jgi:hypothetical protein
MRGEELGRRRVKGCHGTHGCRCCLCNSILAIVRKNLLGQVLRQGCHSCQWVVLLLLLLLLALLFHRSGSLQQQGISSLLKSLIRQHGLLLRYHGLITLVII